MGHSISVTVFAGVPAPWAVPRPRTSSANQSVSMLAKNDVPTSHTRFGSPLATIFALRGSSPFNARSQLGHVLACHFLLVVGQQMRRSEAPSLEQPCAELAGRRGACDLLDGVHKTTEI